MTTKYVNFCNKFNFDVTNSIKIKIWIKNCLCVHQSYQSNLMFIIRLGTLTQK